MIRLTRLNHAPIVLNSDLVERIDVTPDTVITMTTGQVIRVLETADEVIARVVEFRRRIYELPTSSQPEDESVEDSGPAAPAQ